MKKFSLGGVEDTSNWDKSFYYSMYGSAAAFSVAVSSGGSVYITGYVHHVGTPMNQRWVLKKYSFDGVEDTTNWNLILNTGNEARPHSVAIDPMDGSVYFAGTGQKLISSGSYYDLWIKKCSSTGVEDTTNWNLKFDGGGDDYLYSVTVASDGTVFVAGEGYNLTGSGDKDWWIKKFDSDGTEDTTNWDKKIDGFGDDTARSIVVSPDWHVYVVGSGSNLLGATDSDMWIKKFSIDGSEE
jgi:hypothetical protein